MLTVRLDEATERRLAEVCRQLGCSKSDAVKQSLAEWLERFKPAPDPYELGKDLFDLGGPAEPPEDPGKRFIWDYLNAKYRTR
jgi:predicted transcriptional regulator